MPRQALYKPRLAKMINEILGGLSLEQAAIRTGLAGETIRRMRHGKVPEPDTLRAFAEGFADKGADLQQLRIAAGYESDPEEALVIEAFRTAQRAGAEERFLKLAREILEEEKRELEDGKT